MKTTREIISWVNSNITLSNQKEIGEKKWFSEEELANAISQIMLCKNFSNEKEEKEYVDFVNELCDLVLGKVEEKNECF